MKAKTFVIQSQYIQKLADYVLLVISTLNFQFNDAQ